MLFCLPRFPYVTLLHKLLAIMHSILGFVESFSATNFCRFCVIDKSSAQSVFAEDDSRLTLRSPVPNEQYYTSLLNDPTLTSSFCIKRMSIHCNISMLQKIMLLTLRTISWKGLVNLRSDCYLDIWSNISSLRKDC